ncbi:MAG: universal stress protein [Betaproteobacteria bacterium]|nr:universal stress protein [Betaproteobacteria bacterium]
MESHVRTAGRRFTPFPFGATGMNNSGPESREHHIANGGSAETTGAAADVALRRLLLPIDATERSRWGIRYVLARHRAGQATDVALLFVGEPITDWQVLRFRTHDEIARFQSQRAHFLLEEAARPLVRDGIPVRALFREGELAFEILDAAEQLECSEIVLPTPPPRLLTLLSGDVVRAVLRRQRGIPVVTVDENGIPNGHRAG